MSNIATAFTIQLINDDEYLIQTTSKDLYAINNLNWNNKLNGWILKNKDNFDLIENYNKLKLSLSPPKCGERKNNKLKNEMFKNMVFSKYGKGYLLRPLSKKHKDWGKTGNKTTNYYHGGWWREDLDGWFFRGSHLRTLVDNGASEKI